MTDQEYYDEKDSELDLIKEQAFQAGYEKAVHDATRDGWKELFQRANQDQTGQDLDDFCANDLKDEEWDYAECSIQSEELKRGA